MNSQFNTATVAAAQALLVAAVSRKPKRLSTAQKRQLIQECLLAWPNRTNKSIIELVGCSGHLVAKVRAELTGAAPRRHKARQVDLPLPLPAQPFPAHKYNGAQQH